MKISTCHGAKMKKHENSSLYICSACGYASGMIDTAGKKYKKSMMRGVAIYTLVKPDPVPETYNHYPRVTL